MRFGELVQVAQGHRAGKMQSWIHTQASACSEPLCSSSGGLGTGGSHPTGIRCLDSGPDFALRYAAVWSKSICSFIESLNIDQVPSLQGLGTR